MRFVGLLVLLLMFGCSNDGVSRYGAPSVAAVVDTTCAPTGVSFTARFVGFGAGDGIVNELAIGDLDAGHVGVPISHPLIVANEGELDYTYYPNPCRVSTYSYTSSFVLLPGSKYELRGTLVCGDIWTLPDCFPKVKFDARELVWHGDTLQTAAEGAYITEPAVFRWRGAKLYVNEVVSSAPGTMSVNGLRLELPGSKQAIVSHSEHSVACQ